jgi:hypothetical protein
MARPLWQLLLEDPSDLTCDECFAVLEYYAEVLARGGARLFPNVIEHVRSCPHCLFQHSEALRRLAAGPSDSAQHRRLASWIPMEPNQRGNGIPEQGRRKHDRGR